MPKNSKAASAATAKHCLSATSSVSTHRGNITIHSDDPRVTRDVVATVSAFFENEANGFKPALTISPEWTTATVEDDDLGVSELVIAGPYEEQVARSARILAEVFGLKSIVRNTDDDDADIDEDCEAVSAPSRKPTLADDESLDLLAAAYDQLGATYSSYARALASGDDEVADQLARTMMDLEVRIEKMEMPGFKPEPSSAERLFRAQMTGDWSSVSDSDVQAVERAYEMGFISPETRAERIFAARDSKRAGRRR